MPSEYKQIAPRLTRAAIRRDQTIAHARPGLPRRPGPVRILEEEKVAERRP